LLIRQLRTIRGSIEWKRLHFEILREFPLANLPFVNYANIGKRYFPHPFGLQFQSAHYPARSFGMERSFAIPFVALLSGAVVGGFGGAAAGQTPGPYEETIRKAYLSPTKEELTEYLLSLIPNEENRAEQAQLVRQLGDRSFRVREEAEAALSSMPNPPLDLLRQAAESNDPEVRYRARQILKKAKEAQGSSVPHAVFGYVAHQEVKGMAFPLLQYLPYSGVSSAYGLASQAVQATATKDDLPLLRRAIERKPPMRRAIAVLALAKVLGEDAVDELTSLLSHEDSIVRLAAAESLANLGRREALAPLVQLLSSEDVEIRSRSAGILQSLTRQDFQFVAYDDEASRVAAIERWQTWLSTEGETAELHFPLRPFHRYLGRTLMSQYPNTLREIDADGNQTFEAGGFQYVWGCHATDDGTRVVVDFSRKLLREFNAAGKEILRLSDLPGPPSDVRRLENGNFLLALSKADKVVEIDRNGHVVWSAALEGRPTTINRLDNGNFLVNLQFARKVVEIDVAGKVVWELTGLNNALTAQALPNGNVLVCEMSQGRAVEYNREGRVVWQKRGFNNACQAQRLPSGNTLVSDKDGLHEVDVLGDVVWTLDVPRGRFWRY